MWRKTGLPTDMDVYSKSWIPLAPADTRRDKIDGLSRDPREPAFLKPAKDSPLATAGMGGDLLPSWVGAVAPEGTTPWNWQKTWDLSFPRSRLTVSKDPKDKADYDTIAAALANVQPGQIIRVLDDAIYN